MPTILEKEKIILEKMCDDNLTVDDLQEFINYLLVSRPVDENETNSELYIKIIEILEKLLDYEITCDNEKVKIRDWKYIFYSYEDADNDEEPIFGNIISAFIYALHPQDCIMLQYVITYLLSQGCELPEYIASWNTGIIKKEPVFKYIISSGWIIIIDYLLQEPKYNNSITIALQDSKDEIEEFEQYISSLKNTDRYDEVYPHNITGGDEVLEMLYKLTNDINE
jgi:hypothetical protein